MSRQGEYSRKTKETEVYVSIEFNGQGSSVVKSGNSFFDHMLDLFTKHGKLNTEISCIGDTDVDFHHSAEDIGMCLGTVVFKILGDHRGIKRYSSVYIPMDEALCRIVMDLSGRSNLVFNAEFTDSRVNDFETPLVYDFFKAFCDNAKATMHIDLIRGNNTHHSVEAIFKAFGRVLDDAASINPDASNAIPSSKGLIV
ncbi:MAG: imidazoleglycerol-phosphate dehydratase HisB [Chitinivibrionales bacterium]